MRFTRDRNARSPKAPTPTAGACESVVTCMEKAAVNVSCSACADWPRALQKLPTHMRLWHDPLVEVWLMLARMASLSCGKEVHNLMLHSGKRPDVAILGALRNIITDFRTVVGAGPRYCADAAVFPGHGAL